MTMTAGVLGLALLLLLLLWWCWLPAWLSVGRAVPTLVVSGCAAAALHTELWIGNVFELTAVLVGCPAFAGCPEATKDRSVVCGCVAVSLLLSCFCCWLVCCRSFGNTRRACARRARGWLVGWLLPVTKKKFQLTSWLVVALCCAFAHSHKASPFG